MKTVFKTFASGEFAHSEEFQAEATAFKQSVTTARRILNVRSRAGFMDFVEGPLMDSMQSSLVEAFSVPEGRAQKFSEDLTSLLTDVRVRVEESFVDTLQKCRNRPGKSLLAHDWNALKSDLRHRLREIAPCVVQLHLAAQDGPIQDRNSLRHNL